MVLESGFRPAQSKLLQLLIELEKRDRGDPFFPLEAPILPNFLSKEISTPYEIKEI